MTNNYNNVLFLKLILLLLHVVECECFTSIQISLSKQFMCSSSVGRDWDFLRQLLNCTRMKKVQAAFPTTVLAEKGRRQQSRPSKDRLQVMLEECKAELTALCEQYCAEEGWRPPSSVVYKKAHKAAKRKVDHPSARIWDADDLSSGVEFDSEGPPMNNRSPQDSPSTVDGLPHECTLFLSILLPHLHRYFL